MTTIKYFFVAALLQFQLEILPQDQSIFIFDPAGVSTGFQYTLSQLTQDPVFIADSLDDSIYNYDAAFLFLRYPYLMTPADENIIINYTASKKPAYIFSQIAPDINSNAFYNHIGLIDMIWLLVSVPIDSVIGLEDFFTQGIIIDTNFMSGAVPVVFGELDSILVGKSPTIDVNTTYISTIDTLKVILDLYNLIDDEGFLRRVLEYFELQPPSYVDEEFIYLTEFVLSQNYPNPFNPSTKIEFRIADFGFVTLKVYDVLGNEIVTLVNEEKQPGTYEVEFSTKGGSASGGNVAQVSRPEISSGIYFYQLRAGDFIETKKMVLIK